MNFVVCCVQIPSQEFPVLDLVSAGDDYRGLIDGKEEKEMVVLGERESWRAEERAREHSDIILIVFWQVQHCLFLFSRQKS